MSQDPLTAAATNLVAEMLSPFGFVLSSSVEGHRGSSVELVNESVAIRFSADWLEGELAVTVQVAGSPEVSLDDVVGTAGSGLSLSRMTRGISVGMIQRRLETIAGLLISQAPGMLTGSSGP